MDFKINEVARKYVYERFSHSSVPENEKIVNDWTHKVESSQALISDFTKRVGNPKGKKILDLGSGNGGLCIAFALSGAYPTGVDMEEELYRISKEHALYRGVKVDFVLYDGLKVPFDDNTFDYAVSVSVLEHTSYPELYLKEILRTVKPGGMLYLAFPNKWWPRETHTGLWFLTYFPKKVRPFIIKLFKRSPLESHNLHFYNYFDFKRMIQLKEGENFKWAVLPEKGAGISLLRRLIKSVLGFLGLPYKAFLSHVLVVLKKEPK